MIIHINGWPGTGKSTISRLVAARLGSRLVDNHSICNPAFSVTDFGTETFTRVVRQVRNLIFDEIERAPPGARFIVTNVLIEHEDDAALFERIRQLAVRRACPFLAVRLSCELAENLARLDNRERAVLHKLTDVERLRDLRDNHALPTPPGLRLLEHDTTKTAPESNAGIIAMEAEQLLAGR